MRASPGEKAKRVEEGAPVMTELAPLEAEKSHARRADQARRRQKNHLIDAVMALYTIGDRHGGEIGWRETCDNRRL